MAVVLRLAPVSRQGAEGLGLAIRALPNIPLPPRGGAHAPLGAWRGQGDERKSFYVRPPSLTSSRGEGRPTLAAQILRRQEQAQAAGIDRDAVPQPGIEIDDRERRGRIFRPQALLVAFGARTDEIEREGM